MKFNLSDFLELDTTQLLVVNGGSPCGSGSSAPSGSSDSSSGSNGGNGGSSNVTYNSNGTVTYHQKNGQSFTYRTKGSSSSSGSGGGYCSGASDGKTIYANPYYGGNKSSTNGKSNNSQGQGSSKTSSVSNVGGNCSAASSKVSDGDSRTDYSDSVTSWGTINSEYAQNLTMQANLNDGNPNNDYMNDGAELAKEGCKIAGAAKIASEILGTNISLDIVNDCFDANKDGLLTQTEIVDGIQSRFSDGGILYNDYYEGTLSKATLDSIAADEGTTYVLGRAEDVAGGQHWVVLEGYSINQYGQVEFTYSKTSDNDANRTYILGTKNSSQANTFTISKIETYTVCPSW